MKPNDGQSSAPTTAARGGRGARAWIPRAVTLLLAGLAAGVVIVTADRSLGLGLFPDALEQQLGAAATAVLPGKEDRAPQGFTGARGPEGGVVVVPTAVRFDRATAIGLALELERRRARCEQAVASAAALLELGAEEDKLLTATAPLQELWQTSQLELGTFLAVEPERARLCLAALGWPWLGEDPQPLARKDLAQQFPASPGTLGGLKSAEWEALLEEAARPVPWPALADGMAARHKLDAAGLEALQAYLLRRDVGRAFQSASALRQARETLGRLAALSPAQQRALLAMAGARELTGSGTFAVPTLIRLLEREPELGLPLLRSCVERAGVPQQALRAAERLQGRDAEQAERVLLALGPFGAEAIGVIFDGSEVGVPERARAVRERIRQAWPGQGGAMEALGADPRQWRRWYRQAKSVL